MASSSQKQRCIEQVSVENGGDMITRLPDDLLAHILSFLKTNHSFRTSVLSTRWKHVWTLVPRLYFPRVVLSNNDKETRYLKFIEMVLRHSSNVKTFELHWIPQFEKSCLRDWIDAFLEHNKVQEIEIICLNNEILYLQLRSSLFTCKSLVKFSLYSRCPLDIPTSSIYFPCLKVLDVSLVSPSNDLTERLFCSAPVLEELSIHVQSARKSTYNISSSFLKILSMRIFAKNFEIPGCVVNVDAPALETLHVSESCFGHYILKSSSQLAKVFFESCFPIDVNALENKLFFRQNSEENEIITENLISLFQTVSTAKNLSLQGRCPMAVFSCTSSQWPIFANLVQLELDICDNYKSESFSRWPPFPNVKHLQLNMYDSSPSNNLLDLLELAPCLVSLVLSRGNFLVNQMSSVPSCLRSCLKVIEVRKLEGGETELNMIEYLLGNAEALEEMKITCFSENVEELKSEVMIVPRNSKHCKLVFV